MPAESVNYLQRGNHNESAENSADDEDETAENATNQAEEIREMENDIDDHDMSADSAASQAVKETVKQGEGESDNYNEDEAPKRLPNEVLDKIITFALAGTALSVIVTLSSLCQLGDRMDVRHQYISERTRVNDK